MTPNDSTLVFPATTPDAWAYIADALQRGEEIVAAASVPLPEVERRFGARVPRVALPFIHDADFDARFAGIIATHHVRRIVAPVEAVHRHLERYLHERAVSLGPSLKLVGEPPIARQVRMVGEALAHADALMTFVADCAEDGSHVDAIATAALLRQCAAIHGESDVDKLAAMIGIFASAPRGDVIEIGVLMGRTAFLLLALARRHRIGPVLVMDPWSTQHATQHDASDTLRRVSDEAVRDRLAEGFLLNLIPFTVPDGDFNALRLPARDGHAIWQRDLAVTSSAFGRTGYGGRIAVLHIDGNHDFDAVQLDCTTWVPHLVPGGWLILDDYVWLHGDGPRRAGDALLQRLPVQRTFVAGKALFVQIAS